MKTVVTFSPHYNTVFPSSAINFGLRLAPQAGVHNLKTEFSDQKALNRRNPTWTLQMAHVSHSTSQLHIATAFHFLRVNILSPPLSPSSPPLTLVSSVSISLSEKQPTYRGIKAACWTNSDTPVHIMSLLNCTRCFQHQPPFENIHKCSVMTINRSTAHIFVPKQTNND